MDLTLASDQGSAPQNADGPVPTPPQSPTGDDATFDTIASALNAARKPIGVVGIGMTPERDTPAIQRFFDETGIPYVVTCQGKSNASPYGKRFLGHCLPAAGDRPITAWIEERDCVLGVGFDPVESSIFWHFDAPLHLIGEGPVGFGEFQPPVECNGNISVLIDRLRESYTGSIDWTDAAIEELRSEVDNLDLTP